MKLNNYSEKVHGHVAGLCFSVVVGSALLLTSLIPRIGFADWNVPTGKQVVEGNCVSCHGTGVDGAPKIGDRAAWRTRAAQGLSGLTRSALDGLRKMPAHGGNPKLSDLDIARAIAYMVNQSGGRWIEPATESELTHGLSGKRVVDMQCAQCHRGGAGGAPKIGDKQAWVARLKRGLDYTVRSAINGHGGMPARGGMATLTDPEIQNAILYMFDPAGSTEVHKAKSPQAPAVAPSNRATINGMNIYLGLVPAEKILSYPAESPERSIGGGVPKGADYYYLNVSLADAKSQKPVANARVSVDVQETGFSAQTKDLEPLPAGPGSYGNYVRMKKNIAYVVTVEVRAPDIVGANKAKFNYRLR